MNTENILRVADAIEQHSIPDMGFNMGTFRGEADSGHPMSVDLSGHNCGTVACIAGYAETLFVMDGGDLADYGGSGTFFGISDDDQIALIMPRGWNLDPRQYTPQRAVSVLRHLAATGEVDWSVGASLPLNKEGSR